MRWGTRKAGPAAWGRRPGGLGVPAAAVGASGLSALPGYANISEIATGTFATVYRATELGTGRPVALKVLRVADTSRQMVEVFNQELEALSLLSNHPNVTTLYRTFITPEGRPVLVLELCKGSLAQRVRQNGPMPPQEVVRVGVKIAGALETAHRAGLLHRDMKPQNILVSEFDEPVLADFGVAALQVAAQSTEGLFGFTTLHAPPEALEGQPLSPAADIYGLASSMYQLLLGHGPFAAFDGEAPASVILRILRDPAPRPPAAEAPIALADLLEDALAKDPARRPQSAGAFAEALREVEARAGWPQTPYVVWGPPTTGGGAVAEVGQGTQIEEASPAGQRASGASASEGQGLPGGSEASGAAQVAQPARYIPPPPAGPRLENTPKAPPPGHEPRAVVVPAAVRRNVVLPVPTSPAAPEGQGGGSGPEAETGTLAGPAAPPAPGARQEAGPSSSPAASAGAAHAPAPPTAEEGRPRAFTGTVPLTGRLGRGTYTRLRWGDPSPGPSRGFGGPEGLLDREAAMKPLSAQAPLRGAGRKRGKPSPQAPGLKWQIWWAIPLTLAAVVGILIGLGIAALLGHL